MFRAGVSVISLRSVCEKAIFELYLPLLVLGAPSGRAYIRGSVDTEYK